MGKTALIFTGQGSQFSGMGKDFYDTNFCSREVYEKFDKILQRNISELAFGGTDGELTLTINAQPCILATEIAILEAFKQKLDIKIDFAAGHSLGEYAAFYAAGVIDVETAAKLINARANAMNKVNIGSMSAILGLSDEVVQDIISEASNVGYISIANYNTPGQIVLTGVNEAIALANKLALEKGAKKAVPLAVSGAFHSKLMLEAAAEFENTTTTVSLSDAIFPVVTNIDALPTTDSDEIRQKMPRQICSSVYWTQTLNYLKSQGVDHFIEIGPKKVLSGMVKRTLSDVKISAICSVQDLDKFSEEIKIGV